MADGLQIFNASGELRLDLQSYLTNYLGSVTKPYSLGNSRIRLDFVCPVSYSGNILVYIVDTVTVAGGFLETGKYTAYYTIKSGANIAPIALPSDGTLGLVGYGRAGTITCFFIGI